MSDDLERRLSAALSRQVDAVGAPGDDRPGPGAVIATARRRSQRRRVVAGALAVIALAAAGATVAWTSRPAERTVEVASTGDVGDTSDGPGTDRPPATDLTEGPTSTTAVAAAGVTTPAYQSLAWFPLVDGVDVAWQAEDGRTSTYTRSRTSTARRRGTEGRDPRAFVVPTGAEALVVAVFAGPTDDPPAEVAVNALDEAEPVTDWAPVTWDPVAGVGWARLDWPGPDAPTEDLGVSLR